MCACLTHRKPYSNRYKRTDVRKEKRTRGELNFYCTTRRGRRGWIKRGPFYFIVRFPLPKLLRVGGVVSIETTWKRDRKRRQKGGRYYYYYTILCTHMHIHVYTTALWCDGRTIGNGRSVTSLPSNVPCVTLVKKKK